MWWEVREGPAITAVWRRGGRFGEGDVRAEAEKKKGRAVRDVGGGEPFCE